jgi:hypothetical protein
MVKRSSLNVASTSNDSHSCTLRKLIDSSYSELFGHGRLPQQSALISSSDDDDDDSDVNDERSCCCLSDDVFPWSQ